MDYHLRAVGKQCTATGQELVPGTVCHSVLIEKEGELVRLDYSEQGWSGPPPDAVGIWRCIVPQPVASKRKMLDTDGLMAYFDQLTEDADPTQEKFRYVLALLLLQKRRLKLEGSRREGDDEYLQLVSNRGEGAYEVRDFQLDDAEMSTLQTSLSTQLMQQWS